MPRTPILISFVGPSCAGKSSCFQLVKGVLEASGYQVYRADVAYPLRCIQTYAYHVFGKDSPGKPEEAMLFKQDGELLSFLASHFEDSLGCGVTKKINAILDTKIHEKVAIINTDCRNNVYKTLLNLGFVFVKLKVDEAILAKRRVGRYDITSFDSASLVEQYDDIVPLYTVTNNGTLVDLREEIKKVVLRIINAERIKNPSF